MNRLLYKNKNFDLFFKEFCPPFWAYQWDNKQYHNSLKKLLNCDPDAISIFVNREFSKYFPENLNDQINKNLSNILSRNWAAKHLQTFEEKRESFRTKVDSLSQVSSKTLNEFRDSFRAIFSDICVLNAYSNGFYFISIYAESILREKLDGHFNEASLNRFITENCTPIYPTVGVRYQESIQRVIENLKKELSLGNLKDTLIKIEKAPNVLSSYPYIKSELESLRKNYYWFLSFNVDKPRTILSFVPDLISAIKIDSRRRNQTSIPTEKPQEKDKTIDDYVFILRVSGYIKEEISSFIEPYFWYSLRDQWEAVMRLRNLNLVELQNLTYDEIFDGLKDKTLLKDTAKQRNLCGVFIYSKKTGLVIKQRNDAKNFIDTYVKSDSDLAKQVNIKEFRGIVACQGLVREIVHKIENSREIGNFPKGKILVAAYTAPEFVPAMKKAIAIVTDIGGITSHAAIVSRELSIPCIVGTKIATQVLKNGDEIEVDANSGIIRILKKRKKSYKI